MGGPIAGILLAGGEDDADVEADSIGEAESVPCEAESEPVRPGRIWVLPQPARPCRRADPVGDRIFRRDQGAGEA